MSHITEFEHLKIKLEAIKSATNNFATENCIGKGGFGDVYKGEIVHSKGKSMVAFKRLDRAFGQGNTEFWKEITMLFQYKHENLVLLLGFCDESDEKILVYDYACNKSLDFHLNNNDLTWTQRMKICLGIARGLAYLHSYEGGQVRVLHRDIKSSNILLNEKWNAKISDFGLSKFAHANRFTFLFTSAVGTVGYCDPLYAETGLLTKESDVYSLGVVLFEVLCGRLCISNNDDRPLTVLARQCYELNRVDTIIFGNIRDEIDPDSLRAFTQIAYQCLKRDREERPLISTVVTVLEMALEYQSFKDAAASSIGSVASLMVAANPSMPHAAGPAGSHGAVQHLIAATPPAMADSEHLMKYARVGSSDDVSAHPWYDDLPKTVLQTLNLGSNVMSMDFHPQQQHILLVGTNVGEISIWKVQRRDQLQHIVPFKVWDITSCSMQFQINMKKNASVSVKRCTWGPDGSVLGVAFSKHIVHVYKYNLQSQELKELLEIDAHDGGVNDIAFAHPYKQLSIVTCGDDKTIKVWDAVGGGRQCMFVGHEAPVYSVCPHYKEHIPYVFAAATDGKIKAWRYDESEPRTEFDALGLCCTTMAYSKDGTRLFTCGTSEEGEAFLAEWDDSIGAVKRLYSGFGKQSSGVVQFETTRNRFLAAGDEFQIKFWDMDSADMLEATNADDELPERPRLRFNKEGSFLAVTTRNNGIKILARSDGNGDGKILARSDWQNMIRRLGNPCIRVIYELE